MKYAIRNERGVSGLVIVLATAFLILFPLGLMGYEYMRYSLVQQELRSVADAAALSGAVGIATNGGVAVGNTIWQQDKQAMSAAYNAFCINSVTDCPFIPVGQSGANVNKTEASSILQPSHFNNPTPFTNVPARTAEVNFVLLDGSGTVTNWASGSGPDQAGLISASNIRVDAYYGYALPILGALGIGPFTMTASSTGGLPQLDVILCFDVSGSMDDFTNVTFINRYWVDTRSTSNPLSGAMLSGFCAAAGLDASTWQGGCIEYDVLSASAAYPANPPAWNSGPDGSASGPLYYVTGCNNSASSYNGTTVNVQPPMNLNQEGLCPNKFLFMAGQRNSGSGKPPGNYDGSSAPPAGVTQSSLLPTYTDLIVNMNNTSASPGANTHWNFGTPASQGGFTFNDVAWAAEASRGNLEGAGPLQTAVNPLSGGPSDNNFFYIIKDATGVPHYGSFTSIKTSGQVGSRNAYWNFVQNSTQPLHDAVTAAANFFTFLYGSADCHFGLICFSDGIGQAKDDTWADGWQSPPGSTHLNGWTTATVTGSSSTPPLSANVAGPYTGGSGMGMPTNTADPNGNDLLGGDGKFVLPLITLNDGAPYSTASNFDNYNSGSPVNNSMKVGNGVNVRVDNGGVCDPGGIVATGSTDITDALAEAVRQLNPANGLTRPNATRAIVLFTDGSPNIDPNAAPPAPSFTTCVTDCQTQATAAHTLSPPITIFSIGLAMDNNMKANQSTLLNAITTSANGGPSGPSSWQQITNQSQIQAAFQSIAKNLVVITK